MNWRKFFELAYSGIGFECGFIVDLIHGLVR